MATDPIVLAAQARAVLQQLHLRNDTIVRLKSDKTGFKEDALTAEDRENPGHYRLDKKVLTLDLDALLMGKDFPDTLEKVEDWRKYPVLAGVAAHESAHARFSLWGTEEGDEFPETIPNPDFDPFNPQPEFIEAEIPNPEYDALAPRVPGEPPVPEKIMGQVPNPDWQPEFFRVDQEDGMLTKIATLFEEARVERIGMNTFTKTWRGALPTSGSHLVLEKFEEQEEAEGGQSPLDAAVSMAILVGGRQSAGSLGITSESRKKVKAVLAGAQKIIEQSLAEKMAADPDFDPWGQITRIIADEVYSNEHTDAVPHLEAARQLLKIVHPETEKDPDKDPNGDDEGEDEGAGGGGAGGGAAGPGTPEEQAAAAAMAEALREAKDEMTEALDGMVREMQETVERDMEQPESDAGGGYGAVHYKNPQAPQIARHEPPTKEDRELYKRALAWMEKRIEATTTETESGQWLPTGGARLNVGTFIKDNLAGHKASQRNDWDRVSETVKPAPPVKVAIMLDGSGSMHHLARTSAAIAWAAANAAAQLPESRTVSVVYGAEAQMTQAPGHKPARDIAVSRTDGPWENFASAARLVEEGLWLDEPTEDDAPTNTLIVIVSDLHYGGHDDKYGYGTQANAFNKITQKWADQGYHIVVVGAGSDEDDWTRGNIDVRNIERVDREDLFK